MPIFANFFHRNSKKKCPPKPHNLRFFPKSVLLNRNVFLPKNKKSAFNPIYPKLALNNAELTVKVPIHFLPLFSESSHGLW